MATLTIKSEICCGIKLNGGFLGIIDGNGHITVPVPERESLIEAIPDSGLYEPSFCFLTIKNDLRLSLCSSRLCKWSEELYILEIVFSLKDVPLPPIMTKESSFKNGFLGLCGGYLVLETNKLNVFNKRISDFTVWDNFIIAQKNDFLYVLNDDLSIIHQTPFQSFNIKNQNLEITFSPGFMDFFKITNTYGPEMKLTDFLIDYVKPESNFDIIRCFCQAVRLDLEEQANSFLTASLKSDFCFSDIKNFLGVFSLRFPDRHLHFLGYKLSENY